MKTNPKRGFLKSFTILLLGWCWVNKLNAPLTNDLLSDLFLGDIIFFRIGIALLIQLVLI